MIQRIGKSECVPSSKLSFRTPRKVLEGFLSGTPKYRMKSAEMQLAVNSLVYNKLNPLSLRFELRQLPRLQSLSKNATEIRLLLIKFVKKKKSFWISDLPLHFLDLVCCFRAIHPLPPTQKRIRTNPVSHRQPAIVSLFFRFTFSHYFAGERQMRWFFFLVRPLGSSERDRRAL